MTLTVGMAIYKEFDGVWPTVKGLKMNHSDDIDEIIVVDNQPDCDEGNLTRRFCKKAGVKYIPFDQQHGTAQPRNEVFRRSTSDYTLCIDPHVQLESGMLRDLKQFLGRNDHQDDLVQGPMIGDNGQPIGTHQDPVWRGQAKGIWCRGGKECVHNFHEHQGSNPHDDPFTIDQQGMGFFAARTESWIGFHPDFRGFGGCESYVAEMYRRRGNRVICLPSQRWHHKTTRVAGTPYPNHLTDRLSNYMITADALGWDKSDLLSGFCYDLDEANRAAVMAWLQNRVHAETIPTPAAAQQRTEIVGRCPHPSFRSKVDIRRWETEGVMNYGVATIAIVCGDCGEHLRFANHTDGMFIVKPPE